MEVIFNLVITLISTFFSIMFSSLPIIIMVIVILVNKKGRSSLKIPGIISQEQNDIEPIYRKSEKEIIKTFIKEELKKNNYNYKDAIEYIEKRKFNLTLIFSILNFLIFSTVFFHISSLMYLLLILNVVVYIMFIKKYNIVNYLYKQVKARPDEDISLVVSSVISDKVMPNYAKKIIPILISIILPMAIFFKPMMFYEKYEDGYSLRFYTMGLINKEEIKVPETYKGKKVLSIRGNVFANLRNLKKIYLPDSIKEIRGRVFLNDSNLIYVKLPNNLNYLGGSAFKNCTSLEKIELPDTLTEINGSTFEGCKSLKNINLSDNITSIHGSAFKNCSSLESIKLPENITEIRGNTFEECTSLKSIEIPDNVTRIGGHAFYGATNLSEVKISENSKLNEIGSSAFRKCSRLYSITLPSNIYINERAFKESPTIVKQFGEEDNTVEEPKVENKKVSFFDESKFKHVAFSIFSIKEEKNFVYYKDSKIYNSTLTLKEVKEENGVKKFIMEYKMNGEVTTFTITKDTPYKVINSDIAVKVSKVETLNTYSNFISLYLYYN